MSIIRKLAAAALLTLGAQTAAAASFEIAFDAADFDFDGFFDELSTPAPLTIAGGAPAGLDGLDVELFYDVAQTGSFVDIWTVDNTDANSFTVVDDGSSLVFTGLFDDLDFADSDPTDTVVMTISGFAPSRSVIESLLAAPDDFFAPASEVAPASGVAPIPLPAALPMLAAGALALVGVARRRG
jgi:hypothetical protein